MTPPVAKPLVVLVPGNMCDSRLWGGTNGPLIKALERQLLSWAYAPPLHQDTITDMARSIAKDTFGPLVLVGHSMGGIVALELLKHIPDRVVGLILISTNAKADAPEKSPIRLRQQDDIRAGHLLKVVTDELKPNYLAASNRNNLPLRHLLTTMALELGPDVFCAQSEALRTRANLWPLLSTISVPTHFVCGLEDELCPPDLHQMMADDVSNAGLTLVPDAGHLVPLEQRQALADIIMSFLLTLNKDEAP
jgi:pimeloyl-ACP methyl ester carboxylesterase